MLILSKNRAGVWASAALLVALTGCGSPPSSTGPVGSRSPTEELSSPPAADRTGGTPSTSTLQPSPRRTPPSNRPTTTAEPKPPGLAGDRRNAFAFAPLDDPTDVTVEGHVSSSQAWSTSKVLVVAAFLRTTAGGDPERVSATNRRLIRAALTKSDTDAVLALRNQIRGRPGPAMTRVLRAIGDTTTVAPDRYEGLMPWSIREQVRFMAALDAGKVVSRAASAYLLESLHPVEAHSWGLGTIGATAWKGGWLRADTVTRQMGIVDGYAVAIITDAVGPAVRQSDGDSAHVRQMNRIARLLQQRLAYEQARR